MLNSKVKFSLYFYFIFITNVLAQENFPKGYFIMPINPGMPVSLSGAFADIRTNHFHAGLDIRTGGVEGKNVYAAAAGYVSRIKIQNGGYGNCLYITHPNGYTTVYAHLKVFNDTLQHYLIEQQYVLEKWELDLELKPDQFQVNQGNIIALSGNTGGSGGPHLHFEIRDANEDILDPSQFGFYELRDTAPPVIEFITLKTMSTDARINGRFGSFNFPVVKLPNGLYKINQKITARGTLALEVLAYDKTSNSPFRQGVNQINLNVNGKLAFNFKANRFAFFNKIDMNCHVNYEKMNTKNQKIHKCYVSEGNTLTNYQTNTQNGLFNVYADFNTVDMSVNDSFGNNVGLYFDIFKETDGDLPLAKPVDRTKIILVENFLAIESPFYGVKPVKIIYANEERNLELRADSARVVTYVLDLKYGMPSQIFVDGQYVELPVNITLKKDKPVLNLPNVKIDASKALYADNYIKFYADDYSVDFHKDLIPLKSLTEITWRKSGSISYPDKLKAYIDESKPKYLGGIWTQNTIQFKTKEYGRFVTLYDFNPPYINPRIINDKTINLRISDDISGIAKIEAFLEGKWLLMNFEYKSGQIWAEKRDLSKPFEGNLVVNITDNCGNTQTYTTYIAPKI
jgi:Peptidase family M23